MPLPSARHGILAALFALLAPILAGTCPCALAQGWTILHKEAFDTPMALGDKQTFGKDGWLTAILRGKATITVENGRARFSTPSFQDSALIQITESLPAEYKLSVTVADVRYAIENYSDQDFSTKGFKYNKRYLENGFYWLTLTDRQVEATSGEDWWHRYRKVVIDSDDHLGERFPAYMAYMNPALDRSKGDWLGGASALLRCWSKGRWDTRDDNWSVAFRYDQKATYRVELEKTKTQVVMRAFNGDGTLIEETTPVSVDDIYAMGRQASRFEYAYVGEPHIDSYKGSACVKEITLSVPSK